MKHTLSVISFARQKKRKCLVTACVVQRRVRRKVGATLVLLFGKCTSNMLRNWMTAMLNSQLLDIQWERTYFSFPQAWRFSWKRKEKGDSVATISGLPRHTIGQNVDYSRHIHIPSCRNRANKSKDFAKQQTASDLTLTIIGGLKWERKIYNTKLYQFMHLHDSQQRKLAA